MWPDEAINILPFGQPSAVDHALLQILRNIARHLFVRAVQTELPRFGDAGELKPERMVAPGRAARPWPARNIATDIGAIEIARLKVRTGARAARVGWASPC
ncbi:hypothetical protein XF30_10450 [Bradyrhizobium sp. SUTN9-2]|nr:hypothetical protein XF30_10450 [Bradyrhizobium sp. SUTN9-2]